MCLPTAALPQDRGARIRSLNDALRKTFTGGRLMLTQGVNALPEETKGEIIRNLRTFDKFDLSNDPHHEHDFGSFEVNGERYFFKIDYYDLDLEHGSEDPADITKTCRVLTVMRADEY